jgi:hypothetical protein
MTSKNLWTLAAGLGLPLISISAYLLWVWPRPRGTTFVAETGPYVLSLLTGLPFVWKATGPTGRWVVVSVFLAGGFVVLWVYALAVLCSTRGVCL